MGSKGSQIAALAAAIYVLGTPLFAQTNEDWALCLGRDFASPDLPIKGCTAVIQTGRQVLRNLATAYNNRGVAYRLEAKYEEAIRDFDEAIRLVPDDAHAFNNRGVAYRNMGNFDRAVADYDRAISIKSDFTAAYYNRGLVLADKKQYAKAISDFTTVLQVDAKNAMVLYRRGTAYLNSGDAKNGNADLAEARAISPNIAADVNRAEP